MSNWKHKEMTEQEIKKLVRDVYDNKIFTSFQCNNMQMMVFMPLFFLGSAPSPSPKTDNNQLNRKNKLIYIDEKLTYERETVEREAYINNIGMVYSLLSDAGPTSINGYPIFYGMNIVSKEDAVKFIDIYNKYIKIREEFEKEWTTE